MWYGSFLGNFLVVCYWNCCLISTRDCDTNFVRCKAIRLTEWLELKQNQKKLFLSAINWSRWFKVFLFVYFAILMVSILHDLWTEWLTDPKILQNYGSMVFTANDETVNFFPLQLKFTFFTVNYFSTLWLNFVIPYAYQFIFFCCWRLTVTGPIETLKEELVCLNTLFINSFKNEQITSVFQNRLAYTRKET